MGLKLHILRHSIRPLGNKRLKNSAKKGDGNRGQRTTKNITFYTATYIICNSCYVPLDLSNFYQKAAFMKFSLLFLVIILSRNLYSQENPKVLCDLNQSSSQLTVKLELSATLHVQAHEYMSGYRWKSEQGLQRTVIVGNDLGSVNTVEFLIDEKLQNSRSQTYTFVLKRSWESHVISTCRVTVFKI